MESVFGFKESEVRLKNPQDYFNDDNEDHIYEQYSDNETDTADTENYSRINTKPNSGSDTGFDIGYLQAIHQRKTKTYLILNGFLGETDVDHYSDCKNDDVYSTADVEHQGVLLKNFLLCKSYISMMILRNLNHFSQQELLQKLSEPVSLIS